MDGNTTTLSEFGLRMVKDCRATQDGVYIFRSESGRIAGWEPGLASEARVKPARIRRRRRHEESNVCAPGIPRFRSMRSFTAHAARSKTRYVFKWRNMNF